MSSRDRRPSRRLRLTSARLFLVLILSLLAFGPARAQVPAEPAPVALDTCGTPGYREKAVELARTIDWRPLDGDELRSRGKMSAQGEVLADTVGQTRTFWADSFETGASYQLNATCMAVGVHCYIYVENGQSVDAAKISQIANQFDNNIYARDTTTFGSEPNPGVDGDAHIYILLLDIQDGWDGHYNTGYIAGYFYALNEYRNADLPVNMRYSNEKEIFFMDVHPATPASTDFFGTLAHEFQHMIHWNQDPQEETWVDEGCADLAKYLCGYGYPTLHLVTGSASSPGFLEEPDHQLTLTDAAWNSSSNHVLASYGASFMWTLYLWEHYGGDTTITALVDNTQHGTQGVDSTLAVRGQTDRFEQAFKKWVVANYIDEGTGPWGYASIQLVPSGSDNSTTFQRPVLAAAHSSYPVGATSRTVNYYAGAAIKLTGGSQSLNLSFDGANDNRFAVYVVRSSSANLASGTNTVSEVALDGSWDGTATVAGMGSGVQAVLLIPESLTSSGGKGYTYSAALGQELATATPTPSATLTPTRSATPTQTRTATPTETQGAGPTATPTATPILPVTATPTLCAYPPCPTVPPCAYPPCETATPTPELRRLQLPILLRSQPIVVPTATPTPTATATTPAGNGIHGRVTYYGAPAGGLELSLRWYDGASWWTRATAVTAGNGTYAFTDVPGLGPDEIYYVRYLNGGEGSNPAHLFEWNANRITNYVAGSDVEGGDFDVANVAMVSPAPGAGVYLPQQFCWQRRNIAGDNYVFELYDPIRDEFRTTDYLGDVPCALIGSLPDGWVYGRTYRWDILVFQGSDPDAVPYNYGSSYYYRAVTVYGSYSAGAQGTASPAWRTGGPVDPPAGQVGESLP